MAGGLVGALKPFVAARFEHRRLLAVTPDAGRSRVGQSDQPGTTHGGTKKLKF
jgi:hypothetical protein